MVPGPPARMVLLGRSPLVTNPRPVQMAAPQLLRLKRIRLEKRKKERNASKICGFAAMGPSLLSQNHLVIPQLTKEDQYVILQTLNVHKQKIPKMYFFTK